MILADIDILEHAQCIVGQDRERAIERDEIRGDGLIVDTHEADGKALCQFARQTGLE